MRPLVVKLGGRALEAGAGDAGALAQDLAAVAAQGHPVVLVHGGGAEVSAWMARLGLAPAFAGGRRVTDAATLEVATAVLAGLANKRLVAALRHGGVDAVGLAALDGGLLAVARVDDPALGAVGRPVGARTALLDELLAAGRVPVVASIGQAEGALLNLNADDVAAAVAGALEADALLLLSDAPGLLLDGARVPRLDAAGLAAALDHPEVTGGMRPKLEAARAALAAGARRVAIAAWQGPGTLPALAAGGVEATWFDAAMSEEVSRG